MGDTTPPCCAIAMAMGASLTVPIAAEMIGMLSGMVRVSRVHVSAADGRT